jgi:hypothetical protein
MADQPRFEWGKIFLAVALIVGITTAVGFAVPAGLTLALKLGHTGIVAGSDLFRWGFWVVAWLLTFWQGMTMLRTIHDAIVDDMVVTAGIAALLLMIVRMFISLVYEPMNGQGELLPVITALDTGGALMMVVVALISARINRY